MTGKNSGKYNIKATSEEKPKRKNNARKPTQKELRANNYTMNATRCGIWNTVAWLKVFRMELEMMNFGKVGAPYRYTNSMIAWFLLIFGAEGKWRKAAGDVNGHLSDLQRYGVIQRYGLWTLPDYTTLYKRAMSMMKYIFTRSNPQDERILSSFVSPKIGNRWRRCAIDSTGLNLSNTNLWRKNKWGVGPDYRGWLKLHALVDVDTNEIIAYILTTDKMGDNSAFIHLTDMAFGHGHKIEMIYADSAYEAKGNWQDSESKKYTLVVKFKKNTSKKCNGCLARGQAAREFLSMSYEEWRAKTRYGLRWKNECTFSDFKRLCGECIGAISDAGMSLEVMLKVMYFNRYKEERANLMGETGNGVQVAYA